MTEASNEGTAPRLVDRIGADLLDHLTVCRQCFRVFAAQRASIAIEGCETGKRLTLLAKKGSDEPPKLARAAHA